MTDIYLLKWACWTVLTSAAKSQTGSQFSSVSPFLSTQRQDINPPVHCEVQSAQCIVIIIIIRNSCSSINLSAQQLWYPKAGRHVGPPHRRPSKVGWCRRPSEPRQREAAQRGSEAERDFDQSYSACPALYWAKEEPRYAATRRAPWKDPGMGWDPGKDERWNHQWNNKHNKDGKNNSLM